MTQKQQMPEIMQVLQLISFASFAPLSVLCVLKYSLRTRDTDSSLREQAHLQGQRGTHSPLSLSAETP